MLSYNIFISEALTCRQVDLRQYEGWLYNTTFAQPNRLIITGLFRHVAVSPHTVWDSFLQNLCKYVIAVPWDVQNDNEIAKAAVKNQGQYKHFNA